MNAKHPRPGTDAFEREDDSVGHGGPLWLSPNGTAGSGTTTGLFLAVVPAAAANGSHD